MTAARLRTRPALATSAASLGLLCTALLAGPAVAAPTAVAAPGAVVAPAAFVAPGTLVPAYRRPNLAIGARGAWVLALQRRLGLRSGTGNFGPSTKAAVQALQRKVRLPATGVVDARTWAAVYRLPSASRASRSTARTAAPATNGPATNGKVCPTRGFSWGNGFGAPRSGHSHQGIDLMGRRGTPIYAIESGYVLRARRQGNGALTIVLQGASGSKYFYGHNTSNYVSAGTRVTAGQTIASMGDSGSPGAIHLHFEYWRSGGESAAVDPKPLLRSIC